MTKVSLLLNSSKSIEPIFWLKEFSKSWVNVISDEMVYFEQVRRGDSRGGIGMNGGRTYIERYASNHLWLESLFKIRMSDDLKVYTALIEAGKSIHIPIFGMVTCPNNLVHLLS